MNAEPVIPRTYAAWRMCIQRDCGIPLTRGHVEARLHALRDESDPHTQELLRCYGPEHLTALITWFYRAQFEH